MGWIPLIYGERPVTFSVSHAIIPFWNSRFVGLCVHQKIKPDPVILIDIFEPSWISWVTVWPLQMGKDNVGLFFVQKLYKIKRLWSGNFCLFTPLLDLFFLGGGRGLFLFLFFFVFVLLLLLLLLLFFLEEDLSIGVLSFGTEENETEGSKIKWQCFHLFLKFSSASSCISFSFFVLLKQRRQFTYCNGHKKQNKERDFPLMNYSCQILMDSIQAMYPDVLHSADWYQMNKGNKTKKKLLNEKSSSYANTKMETSLEYWLCGHLQCNWDIRCCNLLVETWFSPSVSRVGRIYSLHFYLIFRNSTVIDEEAS